MAADSRVATGILEKQLTLESAVTEWTLQSQMEKMEVLGSILSFVTTSAFLRQVVLLC